MRFYDGVQVGGDDYRCAEGKHHLYTRDDWIEAGLTAEAMSGLIDDPCREVSENLAEMRRQDDLARYVAALKRDGKMAHSRNWIQDIFDRVYVSQRPDRERSQQLAVHPRDSDTDLRQDQGHP